MITLVDVYGGQFPRAPRIDAINFLWRLLSERTETQSISHRRMPTWDEHEAFVASCPYLQWHLIKDDEQLVGSIYVTTRYEVGLFVLQSHTGKGYGQFALDQIKAQFKGLTLYANVAPKNSGSQRFFDRNGFRLVQYTYVLESNGVGL